MKTKMNFKQIAAIAVMIAAGTTSAFSQAYTLPSVGGEGTDTVAIGSKARYTVTRDAAVNTALFNASGFNWANSSTFTFEQTTGAALTFGADGAADQNEVVMNATGPVGTYSVTAAEESRPLIGIGCTDATPSSLPVEIVAMPTMGAYGADSGNCSAPAISLPVPATFTGYGNYDVRLNVAAFDLASAAIGAPQNLDLTNQADYYTTEAGVAHRLAVPLGTLTTAAGGSIPAAGCYFVITATNLQDRISKKHHNYAFNVTNVANANPDAADEYRFYIYPTPNTAPIQHYQNNY